MTGLFLVGTPRCGVRNAGNDTIWFVALFAALSPRLGRRSAYSIFFL